MGDGTCSVANCSAAGDDMIWYVPFANTPSFYTSNKTQVQVIRRTAKNHPTEADHAYNWEETVCLNLIMQQLDFFVTCAVCTKTDHQNLQIIRKNSQQVHPSPSRRRMDSKGEREEITFPKLHFSIDGFEELASVLVMFCAPVLVITFPKLHFSIDGFEEVFTDIIVREGECVCVELVARDRGGQRESVIFLGSIKYEVLKQVHDKDASSNWKWAQQFVQPGGPRREFVRMRGPHGKGIAEMAVMAAPNCEDDTPLVSQSIQFLNIAAVISPLRWLREKQRTGSIPLNAFLTYITLSWNDILDDVLSDRPKRPVLTADPPSINSGRQL